MNIYLHTTPELCKSILQYCIKKTGTYTSLFVTTLSKSLPNLPDATQNIQTKRVGAPSHEILACYSGLYTAKSIDGKRQSEYMKRQVPLSPQSRHVNKWLSQLAGNSTRVLKPPPPLLLLPLAPQILPLALIILLLLLPQAPLLYQQYHLHNYTSHWQRCFGEKTNYHEHILYCRYGMRESHWSDNWNQHFLKYFSLL